jgi:hypothetical protein
MKKARRLFGVRLTAGLYGVSYRVSFPTVALKTQCLKVVESVWASLG